MDRYHARFGQLPPMMAWHRDEAHLTRLMDRAIVRGVPLTAEAMWKAQCLKPPPEDSVW